MHILVVEDHPPNRRFLSVVLQVRGYQVSEAEDGHQALTLIETSPPFHLFIIDLHLPDLDGITLIDHLQQHTPQPRIIAISAYDHLLTQAEGKGVDTCLTKPFSHQELMKAVRALNRSPLL